MNSRANYICSCGLSAKFPMCDGNHFVARGRDPTKLQRCGPVSATAMSASAPEPDQRQRLNDGSLVGA
jgi:CDGSH-type Zn-finger protein